MSVSARVERLVAPALREEAEIFENTDLGNARRLVSVHGRDLRYVPQLGHWMVWDKRRWDEDLTGEVPRRAKQVTEATLDQARGQADAKLFQWGLRSQSAAGINNMISLAATEPGIPVLVGDLDADRFALNVNNGTINLRTGDLRPHDRRDLITKLAKVDYDPEAESALWERMLREVFSGDEELMEFMQLFAGYSLTGDISEQKMIFAHGAGSNGKSTILNALRETVGDYGMQLDPAVLMASTYDQHPTGLTDLRGARIVTTIETEQGRRLNEALVKSLTGCEPIRARRMRQDYFQFDASHKLWFAGNHLPRISGTDLGIWRRLALVPFVVEFGPDRVDKALPDKLAAERPGILAWAVRGCLSWQRDGLRVPERVSKATADYRTSQDHIGRFLADTCTTGDTCYVKTADLRAAYEAWCHEQGERAWTATAIGRELTSRGFDSSRINATTRAWIGIGLFSEEECRRL